MNEQRPFEKVLLAFASFFEKAIDALRPPFMKLLVVFVVTVLLALLLVKESANSILSFGLVVAVVLIFACLAFALEYTRERLRYSKQTEEELKKTLREVVIELQEEKTGRTPLNPVKLIEMLETRFDVEELRSLCVDLRAMYLDRMSHPSLDYDSLAGQGKAAKVRELVLYCQRRGMLDELASAIRQQRPDVEI